MTDTSLRAYTQHTTKPDGRQCRAFRHRELLMRKLAAVLLFFLTMTLVTGAFVYGNARFPRIQSGDVLPEELKTRLYAVDLDCYDAQRSGYAAEFSVPAAMDSLELTVYSNAAFSLECGGAISPLERDDFNSRLYRVSLPSSLWKDSGRLSLFLRTRQSTGFSFYLCGERSSLLSSGTLFYNFLYGFYLTVFLACVVLFLSKRSEKYLLIVAFYALLSIRPTLFALDLQLFGQSLSLSNTLRNFSNVFSHAFRAFSCVSILLSFSANRPRLSRRSVLALCGGLAALLLLLLFVPPFNDSSYFAAALCSSVTGLIALTIAYSVRQPGTLGLLFGYACSCSVSLYGALVGRGVIYHYLNPLLRVALLENVPFLLSCFIVILNTFSRRFRRSDHLNSELDARVRQREIQLSHTNEQLKGEQLRKHGIMTNIFHDLRNPLFTVQGCIDMLEDHTEEDAALHRIIRDRLKMARQLTEDLFLVSKLEEGQITFLSEPVRVDALCRSIATAGFENGKAKSLSLHCDIAPDCVVLGDGFRLRQAIENLLDNAITYSPEQGVVTLTVRKQEGRVLVSVADQGSGIAPEDLPHLFERYYHSKLADSRKSSGLGLSIAYEIARRHEGTLSVKTAPGKGATFTLSLPPCGESGGGASAPASALFEP